MHTMTTALTKQCFQHLVRCCIDSLFDIESVETLNIKQ